MLVWKAKEIGYVAAHTLADVKGARRQSVSRHSQTRTLADADAHLAYAPGTPGRPEPLRHLRPEIRARVLAS